MFSKLQQRLSVLAKRVHTTVTPTVVLPEFEPFYLPPSKEELLCSADVAQFNKLRRDYNIDQLKTLFEQRFYLLHNNGFVPAIKPCKKSDTSISVDEHNSFLYAHDEHHKDDNVQKVLKLLEKKNGHSIGTPRQEEQPFKNPFTNISGMKYDYVNN